MLFPVSSEYPDGKFLKLSIFASFFLDVIYNNSMFGRHSTSVLDYSLYKSSFLDSDNGRLVKKWSGSASVWFF